MQRSRFFKTDPIWY